MELIVLMLVVVVKSYDRLPRIRALRLHKACGVFVFPRYTAAVDLFCSLLPPPKMHNTL